MLGPLEVRLDGEPVPLGGPKQRSLLAVLLLDANKPISRDRLVDALWGDSPPPSASAALDAYLYRLRKLVGAGRVTRSGAGYVLRVEPGELDIDIFEDLAGRGHTALSACDMKIAARRLTDALGQWRGPPLADLADQPFAASEIVRLREIWLGTIENRIDADLALGRHTEVAGELRALVAAHPLRERLQGQLMLALYRDGRQAAALEAYQIARQTLAQEYGLDPAPELQRLELAILRQDTSLGPAWRGRSLACR